jgi:hypothetical protein
MFNNLSKDVLAYMSPDDMAAMIADLRAEADRMEAWSKQRGHWIAPAPRWRNDAPPPRSQDDYGKVRVR